MFSHPGLSRTQGFGGTPEGVLVPGEQKKSDKSAAEWHCFGREKGGGEGILFSIRIQLGGKGTRGVVGGKTTCLIKCSRRKVGNRKAAAQANDSET